MKPSIGRIVHYRITDHDVEGIDTDPSGDRNPVEAGEVCAAVIVRVNGDPDEDQCSVNLQVLLDGDCQHWVTSATEGDGPGEWFWPPRV